MHQVLMEGMKTVPKNTWLQVVPQLIARIDSPKDLVRNLIHSLLVDVGKQHPQVWREERGEGRGGEGRRCNRYSQWCIDWLLTSCPQVDCLAAVGRPQWNTTRVFLLSLSTARCRH